MGNEPPKSTDLLARFMEMAARALRFRDASKGAPPDPAAVAEMRNMATEAIGLIPDELRGIADQFARSAVHAQRTVELLDASPPEIQEAKGEFDKARSSIGAAIGNTLLPAVAGTSNLSRRELEEIVRAAGQVMQDAKDLKSRLSAEPLDVSLVRDKAATLSKTLAALASRFHDVPESR